MWIRKAVIPLEREIKVGQMQQTSISSSWGLATVTKVEEVKTDDLNGILVRHRYEDVGYDTQDIFIEDGMVLDSRLAERRSRSGMPLEYVYCTGKSIDWGKYGSQDITTQKNIVNAFVINFKAFQREGRGLYFYSDTKGSGKTMIACAVANEILKTHDLSVKFISVTDYIELVKAKDDASRGNIKAILEAGLLILDDVGAQVENKEWITTALLRLVDRRYTNHCPTIYTSNVRMEDLKTDERIAERIYAVSVPVIMPEVNVRRKMADKHTKEFLAGIMQEKNAPLVLPVPTGQA